MSSLEVQLPLTSIFQEFTLFPELPPELRSMVWQFAVPRPRIIKVTRYGNTVLCAYCNDNTIPGIVSASRESRKNALKHHTLAFRSRLPRAIYFSFALDTLYFAGIGPLKSFLGTSSDGVQYTRYADSAVVEDRVRHIIVGCPWPFFFPRLQSWVGCFGNLETAVFEWNNRKHPFEGELQHLRKRWGKSKKAGREFPSVQWMTRRVLQALVENRE